jgi:hypothetical protein
VVESVRYPVLEVGASSKCARAKGQNGSDKRSLGERSTGCPSSANLVTPLLLSLDRSGCFGQECSYKYLRPITYSRLIICTLWTLFNLTLSSPYIDLQL